MSTILAPISYVTSAFSNGILRSLGASGEGEELAITKPELRMILGGASQVTDWEARSRSPGRAPHFVRPQCLVSSRPPGAPWTWPQSGAVELYEQDMIEGVLDLQRSQVQQIMTPRVDLVAIEAESSLVELLDITRQYKYSRVPVFNQTIDEITGVVLSRELLQFADSGVGAREGGASGVKALVGRGSVAG